MADGTNSRVAKPARRRYTPIMVGIAIAVLVLAAFMSRGKSEVRVRTDKATRQDLANTISTNGKVEPVDNFEAHAPAATTVTKIYVKEGDHVKAGQLLMTLADADARAQAAHALAQVRGAQADISALHAGGTGAELLTTQTELAKARADRDAAKRQVDALSRLVKTGAASPAEVEDAQGKFAAADAAVKSLEARQSGKGSTKPEVERAQASVAEAQASYAAAMNLVNNSNIRAPHDGIVYSIPVRQGEFVQQGELLLQSANLKTVQVRAFVDEPEIGRLSNGQSVEITWDALPGKRWEGSIIQVPLTVTVRGTRNVGEVLCNVANSDARLLPDTNVTVNITTARRNDVVTVAREAIHQDQGKRFVYLLKDDKLERREVETGISSSTRIEITKGLDANEVVALGAVNSEPLQEGMAAKPAR